jgi:hypothetical protein
MESPGERVIGEIEANKKLKMRLAELIVSEPDARTLHNKLNPA